jgi:SIR2-like domain
MPSWDRLLSTIAEGNCTPFLGAGINAGRLPLGSEIARQWASSHGYPFDDTDNLQRVAQFLAGKLGPTRVKKMMIDALTPLPVDVEDPDHPLGILASLPFQIYMTTNYDSLMADALVRAGKGVRRDRCYWYNRFEQGSSIWAQRLHPSEQNPVVYHWHGSVEDVDSLVLTEDDYIDFLVTLTRSRSLVPPLVAGATAASCLLMIGHRMADINLRVILRSFDTTLRPLSVFVRHVRAGDMPSAARAHAEQEELTRYLGGSNVEIFYGSARDFAIELRDRWAQFTSVGKT